MGTIGAIIGLIIFGAVIGVLARLVLPGKQNISLPMTIILGILGALAGYWLWGLLGGGAETIIGRAKRFTRCADSPSETGGTAVT